MNICISTLLCLSYLCVKSSAVSSIWNTMGVDAIQMLTTKLDFLEQKLKIEHSQIHHEEEVSSIENGTKLNERWVRDLDNRMKTLEYTILQKECDKKILPLEETVQELSKHEQQQAQYTELAEKLEAIVVEQENSIIELKKELIQIKKAGIMSPEDKNNEDKKTEDDVHNLSEIVQSTHTSTDLQNVVFRKKRFYPATTQKPVVASTIIAFYARMAKDINTRPLNNVDLLYDDVHINNGSGYHATTGYFIAPETGVYVFNWTTRERGDCLHSTSLMVNGTGIGYLPLYSAFHEEDYLATGVVVERINAGDHVHVFITGISKPCNLGRSFIEQGSSFGGWKIA